MFTFRLAILLVASPWAGTLIAAPATVVMETASPSDLMSALRAADFAEIYLISPDISFVAAPHPETVRRVGCKYEVGRLAHDGDTREWRDLEQSLNSADLHFVPISRQPELRIGLLLGDRLGTLRETYAGDLPDAEGMVEGVDQRQRVRMKASFATALKGFAARHPELLVSDPGGASPHCPTRVRPQLPQE
jgi:hypothetical protein